MKTFYVASSISNLKQASDLGTWLVDQGYCWCLGQDWTIGDESALQADHTLAGMTAAMDIAAAVGCDLFVLLVVDRTSHGAHAEFGARLASNREVNVVVQGAPVHIFYYHPLVRLHDTLEDFMYFIRFGRPRGRPKRDIT